VSAAGRISQSVVTDIGEEQKHLAGEGEDRAVGYIRSLGDTEGDRIAEGQRRIERGERNRICQLL
jgi:hypothetical protein